MAEAGCQAQPGAGRAPRRQPGCPVTLAGRTGRPYLAPASGGARRRASHRAGLAQLVEHLICNQGVAGSNPAAGTTLPQVREPPPQAPPRPRRKEDIAAGRQPVIASIPAVSPDLAQAFAEGTTVQLRRLLPSCRRAPSLPAAALLGAAPALPIPFPADPAPAAHPAPPLYQAFFSALPFPAPPPR